MTKTELKCRVMGAGSKFFDRSSMRFFGDTMANYYVPVGTVFITTPSGAHHECYELQRVNAVKGNSGSSAYFDVNTFDRVIQRS